jgi:copper chaperone NosL
MTLMDERYGGELVTRTGKTYTFDSIECMAAFDSAQSVPAERVHDRYVVDFGEPGKLISVEQAIFLQSTQLLSPMGANLTSFARTQDAHGAKDVFGGEILSWSEVRDRVHNEWMQEATLEREGS